MRNLGHSDKFSPQHFEKEEDDEAQIQGGNNGTN